MINHILDDKINILLGKSDKKNKTILVLSGGGVKGIAHMGALKSLEKRNMLCGFKTIIGTSVGSLIGLLHSIGYSPDEMYDFIELLDISKLRNLDASSLLEDFGLDNGKKLEVVLVKLLEAKSIKANITFGELYEKTNINLIFTTVCLNDKQIHYLSHTYTPDLDILTACRMTSSIPIYFVPVKYKNKMYIDGACMENYPIQLFENRLDECVGICLIDGNEYTSELKNIEDYLYCLIGCFFEGIVQNSINRFIKQTIVVSVPSFGTMMNLNLTTNQKKELFNIGLECGNKYT